MFVLVRDNFKDYFKNKKEIRSKISAQLNSYDDGVEFTNLNIC